MPDEQPVPPPGPAAAGSLHSVANAARLLKEFRHCAAGIGVSDMARRLGLGKSTVHRLLTTLMAEGLVEQDRDTGLYRLGLAMHELGSSVLIRRDLHEAALPVLEQIRNRTGESVQVAVRDGREVVYLERLESHHDVRLFRRVGYRNWVHCTSTGKVLIAALAPDDLDRLLDGWRLPRRTPRTIVTREALYLELARVRAQGYGVNVDESEPGAASVAAPIRDADGTVVAALSVVGPTARLTPVTIRPLSTLVTDGAFEISRRLGYRGDRRPRPG